MQGRMLGTSYDNTTGIENARLPEFLARCATEQPRRAILLGAALDPKPEKSFPGR